MQSIPHVPVHQETKPATPHTSVWLRNLFAALGFICLLALSAQHGLAAAAQPAAPPQAEAAPIAAVSSQVPFQAEGFEGTRSLLPYIEWYHDASAKLSIEDIINPAQQQAFQRWGEPFPKSLGPVWLRISIAPMPSGLAQHLGILLDRHLTASAQVWMLPPGSTSPATVRPEPNGVFPLLSSVRGAMLYIRLPDIPPVSFTPLISVDAEGLSAHGQFVHQAALTLLALSAFLCLGRGLFERQEWRIWGGLFALSVLIHNLWGFASFPEGVLNFWDIPGFLAPGLALFALPHAGRHLLYTREGAPRFDNALLLLSLAGLCLSLLPLVPGLGWTVRYMPFWPLALIPLSACTLAAYFLGLPSWGRFWLVTAIPVISLYSSLHISSGGAWGLSIASQSPLIGMALSAMFLAFLRGQTHMRLADLRRSNTSRRNARISGRPNQALPQPAAEGEELLMAQPVEPQLHESPLTLRQPQHTLAVPVMKSRQLNLETIEQSLRVPLDALLRQAIALEHYELPEAAKKHVGALVAAGREINSIITHLSRGTLPLASEDEPTEFDLPSLLRGAHDSVMALAEARNLALSWYMAPHLTRRYKGPARRLSRVLTSLLESSINATAKGSVQLWARRAPESNDPGCILFTVADTGTGSPPERRSSLVLAKAWEMAGEGDNALHVESGPSGASISFVVQLEALTLRTEILAPDTSLDAALLNTPPLRVILADDVPSRRQLLAYLLEDLPHEVLEARSAAEAVLLHSKKPAQLIIVDGNMPEEQLIEAVASIRSLEGEQERHQAKIVALVAHQSQADLLCRAGCDHVLYKPVVRAVLRQMVLHLAPVPGMELPPLPAAVEKTPQSTAVKTIESLSMQPSIAVAPAKEKPVAPPKVEAAPKTLPAKPAQEAKKPERPVVQASVATPVQPAEKKAPKGFMLQLRSLWGTKKPEKEKTASTTELDLPLEQTAENPGKPMTLAACYLEPTGSVGEPQPITKKVESTPEKEQEQPSETISRPANKDPLGAFRKPAVAAPTVAAAATPTATPTTIPDSEWVGEPKPIVRASTPAPASGAMTEGSHEWVGEPQPIQKKTAPAALEPQKASSALASLHTPESGEEAQPVTPEKHSILVEQHQSPENSSANAEASLGAGEWVGEPMPLRPKPAPEVTADKLSQTAQQTDSEPEKPLESSEQGGTLPIEYASLMPQDDGNGLDAAIDISETPEPFNALPLEASASVESHHQQDTAAQHAPQNAANSEDNFEEAEKPAELTLSPEPAQPSALTQEAEQTLASVATETAASIPAYETSLAAATPAEAPQSGLAAEETEKTEEPFTPLSMEDPAQLPPLAEKKSRRKKSAFPSSSLLDMIELEPGASAAAKTSKKPEQGFLPLAWPDENKEVLPVADGARAETAIVDLTDQVVAEQNFTKLHLEPEPVVHGTAAPAIDQDDSGEEDSTLEVLSALQEALRQLETAAGSHDPSVMLETSAQIATQAEKYSLHVVAGLARCIEMAAQADDQEAIGHLVPDLRIAIERNLVNVTQSGTR